MSKKQLISADDVRAAAKRGERVLYLRDKTTIVTAQAASTAKDLAATLELGPPPAPGITVRRTQGTQHPCGCRGAPGSGRPDGGRGARRPGGRGDAPHGPGAQRSGARR